MFSRARWMFSCNKCRNGTRQQGDSWCLGCSSLEAASTDLRREWPRPEFRTLAEDIILSAARAVRGLRKAANQGEEDPGVRAASPQAARGSPPTRAPPVSEPRRAQTAGATPKGQPAVKRPRTPPRPPPGRRERGEEQEREYYEEESEEEPREGQKRKHRGGTKHQRHSQKDQDGRTRETHRPLGAQLVERRSALR